VIMLTKDVTRGCSGGHKVQPFELHEIREFTDIGFSYARNEHGLGAGRNWGGKCHFCVVYYICVEKFNFDGSRLKYIYNINSS